LLGFETKTNTKADKVRSNKSVALLESTTIAAAKAANENGKRSELELEQLTDLLEEHGTANKNKIEELVQATGAWRDEASELEMVSRSSVEETKINTESQIKVLFFFVFLFFLFLFYYYY
jgi:endonuclease III